MGRVGQEIEANPEIKNQDGQSIYARLARLSVGDGALNTAAQDLEKRSKSDADVGMSAARLATGAVSRKVKTKVEVRDRDGQSIKGRTCNVAGRCQCAEHGSAKPRSSRGSRRSQSRRSKSIEGRH